VVWCNKAKHAAEVASPACQLDFCLSVSGVPQVPMLRTGSAAMAHFLACETTVWLQQVHLLPGQAVAPCDALATVLDDAVVGWSACTHSAGLHLVRACVLGDAGLGRCA